jgi:hypothetical protein
MEFKELIQRIEKENLLIKESFFTKRTVYEAVNIYGVRIFNLTNNQYKKILKTYLTSCVKEDYNGFTKRFYKVKF